MSDNDRTIVLIDMDCFYVQVEQRLNPALKDKPCAVMQYNAYKGGAIIAVSYEARACGVTRQMRGEEAQQKCPNIQLVRVPVVRGKADLTIYREAGAEVIEVIKSFSSQVERASIDEAYIDLTSEVEHQYNSKSSNTILSSLQALHEQNFVCGFDSGDIVPEDSVNQWLEATPEEEKGKMYRLIIAGCLVQEIRRAIAEQTGFQCSAGISYNKVLAKLGCGLHKPNRQTIIPPSSVKEFFKTMSIKSVRNLGGKLGSHLVNNLNLTTMDDIRNLSLSELNRNFGEKTANWLYQLSRGVEHDPVIDRQIAQSIGCSKNFPGKMALDTRDKVKHWLTQLAIEIIERLEKDRDTNKRVARGLTVSVKLGPGQSYSRTANIGRYDVESLARNAHALISEFNRAPANQSTWSPPLLLLSMSAGKFQSNATVESSGDIKKLFSTMSASRTISQNTPSSSSSSSSKRKGLAPSERNLLSYFRCSSAEKSQADKENDKTISPHIQEKDNISSTSSPSFFLSVLKSSKSAFCFNEEKDCNFVKPPSNASSYYSSKQSLNNTPTDPKESCNQLSDGYSLVKPDIVHEDKHRMGSDRSINRRFDGSSTEGSYFLSVLHPNMSKSPESSESLIEEGNALVSIGKVNSNNSESQYKSPENSVAKKSFFLSVLNSKSTDNSSYANKRPGSPKDINHSAKSDSKIDLSSKSPGDSRIDYNQEPCSSSSLSALNRFNDFDYQVCEQCGQKISVFEFPEHSDFHFAQQVQKEFNSSSSSSSSSSGPPKAATTSASANKTQSQSSAKRRGRPPNKNVDSKAPKLTIDKFFTKA